jgi:hypothetical protein
MSVSAPATAMVSATGTVTRFYDRLLEAAQRLASDPSADGPTFAAAIVIAGTACEVAGQRAVDSLIDARGLDEVGEALKSYQRRYTFVDDKRLQKLWTALTGDVIQQAEFWPQYTKHVARRNRAAHSGLNRGAEATRADADKSIAVAKLFVDHVRTVLIDSGLAAIA